MKKYTFIFLFLIFCFLSFVVFNIFAPVNYFSNKEQGFLVEKGEHAKDISFNLKKQGLIRLSSIFRFYVFILGEQGNLKAGRYILSESMSIPEIVEVFISGTSVKDKITIQEGWDLRDIGWYFENKGMFQAEELFELAGFPALDYSRQEEIPFPKDLSDEFGFLAGKPKDTGLEGFLFPDTYEISYGDSLENIVKRILNNFEEKLNEEGLFEKIDNSDRSFFEIMIMASMLEKEVIGFEDKKIVSDILWKRLEIGMPLQVDATIHYATNKDSRWKIDKTFDSPYNTYKYNGLPLGPISNPGIESIKAALEPKESPYLYYLSTPQRETIFSKTLEEHNTAKAKYLK